jgi:hypothetical protein
VRYAAIAMSWGGPQVVARAIGPEPRVWVRVCAEGGLAWLFSTVLLTLARNLQGFVDRYFLQSVVLGDEQQHRVIMLVDLFYDAVRWTFGRVIFAKFSTLSLVLVVCKDLCYTLSHFGLHFSPHYMLLHSTCLLDDNQRVPRKAWPWRLKALVRWVRCYSFIAGEIPLMREATWWLVSNRGSGVQCLLSERWPQPRKGATYMRIACVSMRVVIEDLQRTGLALAPGDLVRLKVEPGSAAFFLQCHRAEDEVVGMAEEPELPPLPAVRSRGADRQDRSGVVRCVENGRCLVEWSQGELQGTSWCDAQDVQHCAMVVEHSGMQLLRLVCGPAVASDLSFVCPRLEVEMMAVQSLVAKRYWIRAAAKTSSSLTPALAWFMISLWEASTGTTTTYVSNGPHWQVCIALLVCDVLEWAAILALHRYLALDASHCRAAVDKMIGVGNFFGFAVAFCTLAASLPYGVRSLFC